MIHAFRKCTGLILIVPLRKKVNCSALPLLVPRVRRADDVDPALAADDFALLADSLDAGTNFHRKPLAIFPCRQVKTKPAVWREVRSGIPALVRLAVSNDRYKHCGFPHPRLGKSALTALARRRQPALA